MSVQVEGLERVDATLTDVEALDRHLLAPMEKAVDLTFVRVLLTTPVDKGVLVASMDKLVVDRGAQVTGIVFSHGAINEYGHRYDHYVKSARYQAWMHRGRVATMEDDLEAVRPQIVGLFERTVSLVTSST